MLMVPLSNQAKQFNPNNYAFHPVTGTGQWNNANLRANPVTLLQAPWSTNVDKRMHCSDCHGRSDAPKGPHGSNAVYLLKATGNESSYDDLCKMCHIPRSFAVHNAGAHDVDNQASDNSHGCISCHAGNIGTGGRTANIHGTNYKWPDNGADPGLTSEHFLVGGFIAALYNDGSQQCYAVDVPGGCEGHGGTGLKSW